MSVIRDHGLSAYDSDALIANAMGRHPECNYGRVVSGIAGILELVEVVQLWVDADDEAHYPPRHSLSYAIENRGGPR